MSRAGSSRNSLGAKPFEPLNGPSGVSKAGTPDDGFLEDEPYAANGTARSAPGRSEREAGRVAGFEGDGKTPLPLSDNPARNQSCAFKWEEFT
ncbi:hypothetical protein GCM10007887_06600 [Methylobacterium haplocladii]|uniref:Uncharacterized protein n=1 Tax=Methylobacterium haplocladii TaxID=1176176 RepID=A0A512IQ78_9HYPH|nr:hypothetical protein MHA02_22280 [Methylobacterium haplocladii]GLS58004.1 hypothetical protein GCM10007887_06600 [Methylobacterium haplocladii]